MRLSLSSAAAPALPLASLLEGCRRRGLAGVELVAGGGHGVDAASAAEALGAAQAAGVALTGVRCEAQSVCAGALALAEALGAPLVLRVAARPAFRLAPLVRQALARGVRVLFLHGSEPRTAARLCRVVEALPAGAAGVAWEVDPVRDDPAVVAEVLGAAGGELAAVVLRGGGPEAATQSGTGVGALMARLTLARFAGSLVLAPGDPAAGRVWAQWLGRRGGWGCGSRHQEPVAISPAPAGVP